MKLLTHMVIPKKPNASAYIGVKMGSTSDDIEHDALAAHALLQANKEWWVESDESGIDEAQSPRDAVRWIEQRADEILKEWNVGPVQ